jgi:hypothetical protein
LPKEKIIFWHQKAKTKHSADQSSHNKINIVPAKQVYEYFKKHLFNPNYLSEDQLTKYLILAF